MSIVSNHYPEAIEEARYFGIDPKEVAAGFAQIGADIFDSCRPSDYDTWTEEDEAEYEAWLDAVEAEMQKTTPEPEPEPNNPSELDWAKFRRQQRIAHLQRYAVFGLSDWEKKELAELEAAG
jgi:hypothetical protein